MIEVEDATKPLASSDLVGISVVVARFGRGRDQSTTEAVMEAFGIVVVDILSDEMPKVALAEDDEVVEAFVSDGADEALSERIAVGAAARYADTFDALVAEHGAPCDVRSRGALRARRGHLGRRRRRGSPLR